MAQVIPFPLERRIGEYRADYSELTEAERRAEPPGVADLFARSRLVSRRSEFDARPYGPVIDALSSTADTDGTALPCDTEPVWPPASILGQPQRD